MQLLGGVWEWRKNSNSKLLNRRISFELLAYYIDFIAFLPIIA